MRLSELLRDMRDDARAIVDDVDNETATHALCVHALAKRLADAVLRYVDVVAAADGARRSPAGASTSRRLDVGRLLANPDTRAPLLAAATAAVVAVGRDGTHVADVEAPAADVEAPGAAAVYISVGTQNGIEYAWRHVAPISPAGARFLYYRRLDVDGRGTAGPWQPVANG